MDEELLNEEVNDEETNDESSKEKLIEKMKIRGNEKLSEKRRFISFDGTINTGSMSYKYGVDFNVGDFVTIMSKPLNKLINAQIVSVSKSITDGVEYIDIEFGYDRITISQLFK